VFEINPRFSGGIPLTIAAGADFPRMLAELALGQRVREGIGRFRENVWMTNHETAIFLEQGEITLEPFAIDLRSTIEEVV
jgi:carbamoyl-phosphate synthase large subunit